MKALSVRQPWPWGILYAGKPLENRTWPLPGWMVGKRVLLHAGKGCTGEEYEDAAEFIELVSGLRPPPLSELPRGAVVGAFTLTGCVGPDEDGGAWHVPGRFGFKLDRVVALDTPIPCKGALGFFDVPPDVEAEIRRRFG